MRYYSLHASAMASAAARGYPGSRVETRTCVRAIDRVARPPCPSVASDDDDDLRPAPSGLLSIAVRSIVIAGALPELCPRERLVGIVNSVAAAQDHQRARTHGSAGAECHARGRARAGGAGHVRAPPSCPAHGFVDRPAAPHAVLDGTGWADRCQRRHGGRHRQRARRLLAWRTVTHAPPSPAPGGPFPQPCLCNMQCACLSRRTRAQHSDSTVFGG